MLFKAYPGSDNIRIIWMIPPVEMWGQYEKGNVTEHEITRWSIQNYKENRGALEQQEPDDLPDETIDAIYRNIASEMKSKRLGLIV
jgi:hypothetical protein